MQQEKREKDIFVLIKIGSLSVILYTDQKVRDFESAVTSNTEQYADYFGYLLDHGIYIAPSQFETMFYF